ncbi:MAG: hypothetical protein Kow0068_11700 [Marinilabiliales bacterium]
MIFKILILQRCYGLGDTQIEYQIHDRLSFKKFLGISSSDNGSDENTIWAFRKKLTNVDLIKTIFLKFRTYLESQGLIINEGIMVT